MLEFQTDVAAANALNTSCAYLTTPTVAALLAQRQRFTSTDSPLWQGNILDGEVVGFRGATSTAMPAATMVFGDFSQVVVAEWGALEIAANPYANFPAGITGIRAFMTTDVGVRGRRLRPLRRSPKPRPGRPAWGAPISEQGTRHDRMRSKRGVLDRRQAALSPGDVVPLATHDAVYLAGLGRVERVTPAEPPAPVAENPPARRPRVLTDSPRPFLADFGSEATVAGEAVLGIYDHAAIDALGIMGEGRRWPVPPPTSDRPPMAPRYRWMAPTTP